jgi:hypothetical protein
VVGARLTKAADLSDRQCTVIDISEGGARLLQDHLEKGDVIGIKFV